MGSTLRALSHFDRLYPHVYSIHLWRSIRLALLTRSKKMFILNNCYQEISDLSSRLKMNGAIDFLANLLIEEKKDLKIEKHRLQEEQTPMVIKIDEFSKSTEYIGERHFYTKRITNSFTNYTSNSENEDLIKTLKEGFYKIKSEMIPYEPFQIPSSLKVLAYPKGIVKKNFPVPHDEYNQAGFYPLDGFSVLVVLLLNLKKGDKVLDMCAAPGGKSIAMLQTGLLSELVCIDNDKSRITRLKNVLNSHSFPEDVEKVSVILGDGVQESKFMNDYFDKVLVDAPCSTDRHAVVDHSFSLFSPQNEKKRDALFASQRNLLRMAVKSCKMGGDVIYSTCTLSPVQNDNVIVSVISEINSRHSHFKLVPVSCRCQYLNRRSKNKSVMDWFSTFNTTNTLGEIILPNILNNYGPGYICKLRKVPIS